MPLPVSMRAVSMIPWEAVMKALDGMVICNGEVVWGDDVKLNVSAFDDKVYCM